MNKIVIILVFLCSICFGYDFTFPVQLVTSAQSVTSTWTDVGSAVKNTGFKEAWFKIKHTINSSSNVRFRVLHVDGASGDSFEPMAESVSSGVASLTSKYYEITTDSDKDFVFKAAVLPVNYFKLQTVAGTNLAGDASCAELDEVEYMFVSE